MASDFLIVTLHLETFSNTPMPTHTYSQSLNNYIFLKNEHQMFA